jgi:hypothetical protein
MPSTSAAEAVGLPDRLLSRSFADTGNLPPLSNTVDLLMPWTCNSTSDNRAENTHLLPKVTHMLYPYV